MQWVPVIALCVTLLLAFLAALRTALTVGGVVAELRKSIEDMRQWRDSVALIPMMQRDIQDLKEVTRGLETRVHSVLPPMREKQDSMSEDIEELKALKAGDRLARVETKLSQGTMPAVRPPRPVRREDPDDR